ncbi:hypothetical protein PsalMR5_03819 [Piscirickettsia salmonis]|uniref:hypothetical protein n=1 Tax=Piscirickettsia salmonis TaxID=1238 RepID=UPI0012BADD3F|nr:hypothetical protein [Piscirickettsia salmonis]QGP56340.1 hypothetical protein PsalSR1_03818 [Piscirickettsia salmonis]QGP57796.1 hypothetical protein PsalBI1_00340 [Piscirickettsia salmonis]QGP65905.1 hypothetical protein PsalMR5_03819 [Piscirickettsia salmonis]
MEKDSIHYKGCQVTYWTHEKDGFFIAEAIIHCNHLDDDKIPHISGKVFTNLGDAEKYIINEAKTWIDAKERSIAKRQ